MAEQDFSLDIIPFSEATRMEALQKQHQMLSQQKLQKNEIIQQVKDFLNQLSEAGSAIEHLEFRSQLRSLILYWSSFVNDMTGEFPNIQLEPFDESRETRSFTGRFNLSTQESADEKKIPLKERVLYLEKKLAVLEELFDRVDLRYFTPESINELEKELREAILTIRDIISEEAPNFKSGERIILNLRRASDQLSVASDLLMQKGRTAIFYKSLRSCQQKLENALELLRDINLEN